MTESVGKNKQAGFSGSVLGAWVWKWSGVSFCEISEGLVRRLGLQDSCNLLPMFPIRTADQEQYLPRTCRLRPLLRCQSFPDNRQIKFSLAIHDESFLAAASEVSKQKKPEMASGFEDHQRSIRELIEESAKF